MKKITLLPLLLIAGTLGAAATTSDAEPSGTDKVLAVIGKAGDIQATVEYIKDKLIPIAENILPAMDKTLSCALAKGTNPQACNGLIPDLKQRGLALPLVNFNQKLCLDVPLTKQGTAVTTCKDYASLKTSEARYAYSSSLAIYMMSLIMNGFLSNKEGKVKGAIPSILEVVAILIPNSKKEWKAKVESAQGSLTDMNNTFEAVMRALRKISESMMYAAKAAETKMELARKKEEIARLKKANPAMAAQLEKEAKKEEQAQQLADLNPFAPDPLDMGGMEMAADMAPEAPAEEPAAEEAPAEEAAE